MVRNEEDRGFDHRSGQRNNIDLVVASTCGVHPTPPPVFSRIRVTRSLVVCVCFVDRCLSFCTFLFCPLCCLFFFDIQIMITPLVFSNSSLLDPESAYRWKGESTSGLLFQWFCSITTSLPIWDTKSAPKEFRFRQVSMYLLSPLMIYTNEVIEILLKVALNTITLTLIQFG